MNALNDRVANSGPMFGQSSKDASGAHLRVGGSGSVHDIHDSRMIRATIDQAKMTISGDLTRAGDRTLAGLTVRPGSSAARMIDAIGAGARVAPYQQASIAPSTSTEAEVAHAVPMADDPVMTMGYRNAVSWLERICPRALERMKGASEAIENAGRDHQAHSTVSCRRAFEALADALHPASKPKVDRFGKSRELGQHQFKNRILRFVDQATTSDGTSALIGADLEALAGRLDRLTAKFEKGVHRDATSHDAQLAFMASWHVIFELASVAQAE